MPKVNFKPTGKLILGIFIVSLSFIITVLIIKVGLQPCGWLDGIYLKHSSCLHKLNRAISIVDMAFVSNGASLATSSLGGQVRLWQVADGGLETTFNDYEGLTNIAVSPDGNILAASSWHTVQLKRIDDGKLLKVLNGHNGMMGDVAFAPDGTTLAVAVFDYQESKGDYKVQLWQVMDGTLLHTLRRHTWYVKAVAFSPDGTILASAGDDDVLLWRVSDGELLYILEGDGNVVESVSFSPDGTILATTTYAAVRLWQISARTLLRTLEGHRGLVYSVAFSPDGTLLASGGEDGSVHLWRVADGNLLQVLKLGSANRGWIYSVVFSPDGAMLATSQRYGPVRFFDVQQMLKQ